MTVTSAAVATTKFLLDMRDCIVDSDVGTGDFSLVPGILHVCRQAHLRSHVPPGMDCYLALESRQSCRNFRMSL